MTRKEFLLAFPLAAAAWNTAGAEKPVGTPAKAPVSTGTWRHQELRRIAAREASQGVAVDGQFLYAISNSAVGKYRKDTGERVGGWEGPKGGPIIHLNAGIGRRKRLYCAHSNFPAVPMVSSIEIWDTRTMQHVSTHSLGIDAGSLTWFAWPESHWYACFAHYAASQPQTGRGPAWTQLIKFDDQWRRVGGWVFPANLIERFGEYSSSGGAFGPGGFLFITGHSAKELYVLEFPEAGSVMKWVDTIAISAEGQAFVFDPANLDILYSISRGTREVIVSRITRVEK